MSTLDEIENSIRQLQRSERGQAALSLIREGLANDSLTGLDARNQMAFRTIVQGLWGPWSGTTADLVREYVPVA